MKKAILLSLFASGSEQIGGLLSKIGVYMGDRVTPNYEDVWISKCLQAWWCVPEFLESASPRIRQRTFELWLNDAAAREIQWACLHHPLLGFCIEDIKKIWKGSRFIWCYKNLEESIKSLNDVRYWPGCDSSRIQTLLWDEIQRISENEECLVIDPLRLGSDPENTIKAIVDHLGISLCNERVQQICKGLISETGNSEEK